MTKTTSSLIARRTWRLLRLSLLWARKGGLFRARLTFHKLVAKLANSTESRKPLAYGDHEFSFDQTPIVRVKMHRPSSTLRFKMPHFSCVEPLVDFDCDFEDDEWDAHVQGTCGIEEEIMSDYDDEEGIDVRAEKFIAEFYEQIKLQRQISYLQ